MTAPSSERPRLPRPWRSGKPVIAARIPMRGETTPAVIVDPGMLLDIALEVDSDPDTVVVDPPVFSEEPPPEPDVLSAWAWQTGAQDAIPDELEVVDGRRSHFRAYAIVAAVGFAAAIAIVVGFGGSRVQSRQASTPAAIMPAATAPDVAVVELGPPGIEPRATMSPEDVERTYRSGLQRFARGDTDAALALLGASVASDPNHTASWRTLALVYEKRGDRERAKQAFARYLALAPLATDASSIRARMEKLGS